MLPMPIACPADAEGCSDTGIVGVYTMDWVVAVVLIVVAVVSVIVAAVLIRRRS